jgi:hypothetical protein
MKRYLVFGGKDASVPGLGWQTFICDFDTEGLAKRYASAYVGPNGAPRWAQVVDLKLHRVLVDY